MGYMTSALVHRDETAQAESPRSNSCVTRHIGHVGHSPHSRSRGGLREKNELRRAAERGGGKSSLALWLFDDGDDFAFNELACGLARIFLRR